MTCFAPARESDAAALAALHAESFPRGWSGDAFAALLAAPGSLCLVAWRAADGGPVGFVLARAVAGEAEILTIAVARKHRRQGIATNLMNSLLDDLRSHGTAALFLEVGEQNAPALKLYRGLGFAEVGRRPGYYRVESGGAPGDALVLRAGLAAPAMVSKAAKTDYEKPV